MSSVVIGGGNFDVGLHYNDEMERQRRLALATQQQAYEQTRASALFGLQQQQTQQSAHESQMRDQQFYAGQRNQQDNLAQRQDEEDYQRKQDAQKRDDIRADILFNRNQGETRYQDTRGDVGWDQQYKQGQVDAQEQYRKDALNETTNYHGAEQKRWDADRIARENAVKDNNQTKIETAAERARSNRLSLSQGALVRTHAALDAKIKAAQVVGDDESVAIYEQQKAAASAKQNAIEQGLFGDTTSNYDEAGTGSPDMPVADRHAFNESRETALFGQPLLAGEATTDVLSADQRVARKRAQLMADKRDATEKERLKSQEQTVLGKLATERPRWGAYKEQVDAAADHFGWTDGRRQAILDSHPVQSEIRGYETTLEGKTPHEQLAAMEDVVDYFTGRNQAPSEAKDRNNFLKDMVHRGIDKQDILEWLQGKITQITQIPDQNPAVTAATHSRTLNDLAQKTRAAKQLQDMDQGTWGLGHLANSLPAAGMAFDAARVADARLGYLKDAEGRRDDDPYLFSNYGQKAQERNRAGQATSAGDVARAVASEEAKLAMLYAGGAVANKVGSAAIGYLAPKIIANTPNWLLDALTKDILPDVVNKAGNLYGRMSADGATNAGTTAFESLTPLGRQTVTEKVMQAAAAESIPPAEAARALERMFAASRSSVPAQSVGAEYPLEPAAQYLSRSAQAAQAEARDAARRALLQGDGISFQQYLQGSR